jgi:SHS2 domain-containing protein
MKKRFFLFMQRYEILEHTTDLRIRAFGKTREELFLNMMIGMFEGAKTKVKEEKAMVAREVRIKSADETSLLVDFLSEILTLSDINNEAYSEIEFKKRTKKEVEAKIFGFPIENIGAEIKAVTYHGLEIKKVNNIWQATVLFDI